MVLDFKLHAPAGCIGHELGYSGVTIGTGNATSILHRDGHGLLLGLDLCLAGWLFWCLDLYPSSLEAVLNIGRVDVKNPAIALHFDRFVSHDEPPGDWWRGPHPPHYQPMMMAIW